MTLTVLVWVTPPTFTLGVLFAVQQSAECRSWLPCLPICTGSKPGCLVHGEKVETGMREVSSSQVDWREYVFLPACLGIIREGSKQTSSILLLLFLSHTPHLFSVHSNVYICVLSHLESVLVSSVAVEWW